MSLGLVKRLKFTFIVGDFLIQGFEKYLGPYWGPRVPFVLIIPVKVTDLGLA